MLDDARIIELYWERSEIAVSETEKKYGSYCRYIAYGILHDKAETEECVNDTWLNAWNSIPPTRPNKLSAFLGRITRNLSLNRRERRLAKKRGGGQTTLVLDELAECIPSSKRADREMENMALTDALNRFLRSLTADKRRIFLRRYWYMSPVKEIAEEYGLTESKVKMTLLRTRQELKEFLEKEEIYL